ncbi:3-hydroxyisobutyrate dehydrogenase-like beta-hydroxyacid dehydrogenase [Stackebrandtia endophytica]|uniref:3-hydroxyisobutyrate dehydrogenase-like beta-hydroxyacid dehydrogenase n=1 Tax=Stackebrandtia endophytica TaxID=1496996 RepID=A0A543B3G4_9ACTN|nr:NAD(P)-dependent oxidoreductase [Stackebrandtia endophytica]TQL79366.1 3-hydroxyisobutyrate dehydrogenase-like beta-hydroxyacid dehydrogenase [Stackebrandtia endophytica]
MNATTPSITFIGLGPMGQAMVRTLLGAGHPITLWNRTAARAEPLVAEGARLADSPAEAVAASDLIILSLTDYQAMYDILSPVESQLAGRTIVNLSSDDPDVTRKAAAWAKRHGANFITGGVMGPAPMVGTDGMHVYYSGQKSVFETHEASLRPIGKPDYLGEDEGLAQLFYLANLDVFLTSLASVLHATALANAAGVPAARIYPRLVQMVTETGQMMDVGEDVGKNLDEGHHPGEMASATMMGATADHILTASKAAGIDTVLPSALKSYYDSAINAGRGSESWTVLYEFIKKSKA